MVFAFHTYPIIDNQFPSGLASSAATECLPILNLLATLILERIKFSNDPMGSVFFGGGHGGNYRLIQTIIKKPSMV